ncbi:hypothetical protein QP150_09005 [Sphingomonas sp. 22L2VL55-3]
MRQQGRAARAGRRQRGRLRAPVGNVTARFRREHGTPLPHARPQRRRSRYQGRTPSPNARIKAFDRNKDGVITAIEWSEGTLAWFDRMDLNHDGTVTSEERAESRKR